MVSNKYNLLIVEDDPVISLLIEKVCGEYFHQIDVVFDGNSGLKRYLDFFEKHNQYYDLVISDILMPNSDGFEMSKKILNINPTQEITIISAFNNTTNLKKVIDLGIKHFLHKPIIKEELITTVLQILESIKLKYEKQQKREEIEKLNIQLDHIVHNFDQYVISAQTDLMGNILEANNAFIKFSGYKLDQIKGKKHPFLKGFLEDFWNKLKQSQHWSGEVQTKKANHLPIWCHINISPSLDYNNNHIGYQTFIIDITDKKKMQDLNKHFDSFINNIDEGFMIVDLDTLRVSSNFSKKCIEILKTDDIYGHMVDYVLFHNNMELSKLFEYGIKEYKNANNPLSKELLLSLLPKENSIDNRTFNIKYKPIEEDNELLIILTDITKERQLQEKIERKQQLQKMVIAVATHKEETIELKNSFELFLENINNFLINIKDINIKLNNIKRTLHTFKGQFAQKEMFHTTNEIHDVESIIANENILNKNIESKKLAHTIHQKLSLAFDQDLEIISSILGEEFLSGKTYLHISSDRVEKLETQMLDLLYNIKIHNKKPLYSLLDNISNLRHSALVDLLGDYPDMVKNISQRLGKKVYPFKIEGDEDIFVSSNIKPFIETLVHVFRNCVDHGIEDQEKRISLGKDPIGRVTCAIYKKGAKIQVIVSDDGAGIDTNMLKKEALTQGKVSQEELDSYTQDELLRIVFLDGFTTKGTIDEISGRGIGLNSVFYELNKIKGDVEIENKINMGTSFIFTLPNTLEIKENSLITQSEENFILNSVINASINFLEKDMNIAIVSKYSEQRLVLEKHFSTIKYDYSNEIFCIVSMSTDVLEKIFKVFIPDEIDPKQKQSLLKSIPEEIANIVCGLSISKFQELDEELTMSEPILFDKKVVNNLAQNNTTISNIIETIYGDFICTIINITKE